eukprot:scaffold2860_cov491-Pavlova_lutheri.AAC.2
MLTSARASRLELCMVAAGARTAASQQRLRTVTWIIWLNGLPYLIALSLLEIHGSRKKLPCSCCTSRGSLCSFCATS